MVANTTNSQGQTEKKRIEELKQLIAAGFDEFPNDLKATIKGLCATTTTGVENLHPFQLNGASYLLHFDRDASDIQQKALLVVEFVSHS